MSEVHNAGEVRMSVKDHIAVITVDNVSELNAFSPELLAQLAQHVATVNNDDEIWVAVICPEGEHTSAGLDMPKSFGPVTTAKSWSDEWIDPFCLSRRCVKPVISVVHGKTFTVGIEMVLAGDIVIAADTATFCQMESKRSITPPGGALLRYLSRTGWGSAIYHLLQCDEFDAQCALEIGFVQEVHPFGRHRRRAMEIARQICRSAPVGLRGAKAAALVYLQGGRAEFLRH